MRKFSVKVRIAIWVTLLMTVLSILMLIFMLSISSAVVNQNAMTNLETTVRVNLSEVAMSQEGTLELGSGFSFSRGGVSTLIYSKGETLLAGQVPVSFRGGEPFQNGQIRTIMVGDFRYLVLDLWMPIGWEDGLWLRGLTEVQAPQESAQNLLYMAAIALPLFILLAAGGSYLLIKKAFCPLDTIMGTAAAISDAKDLSGRIGLPAGSDEFSRLADSFDHMFARLEQSFEAEKQFTADASHELRTPISVIKGACEYAEKFDETPEERQETIEMIHRQANHMSGLVSQLLSMTRLDQGTEVLPMEKTDLGSLTAMVCNEQNLEKRLQVELEPEIFVWADQALLTRLLKNLLENARKYGREDGKIRVTVKRNGTQCLLSVRDDGIGIDPAHQEKIWQRFYQVDSSRSNHMGVGLGLSMVQQIAQVHGGKMTVESVVGIGSIFTLHLPVMKG